MPEKTRERASRASPGKDAVCHTPRCRKKVQSGVVDKRVLRRDSRGSLRLPRNCRGEGLSFGVGDDGVVIEVRGSNGRVENGVCGMARFRGVKGLTKNDSAVLSVRRKLLHKERVVERAGAFEGLKPNIGSRCVFVMDFVHGDASGEKRQDCDCH